MIVQPAAWRADLAQAVARVTRVSLADLLGSAGGNAEERQALVNRLRGGGTVAARVLEIRADGVSILELANARVAIRLSTSAAPGEQVLMTLADTISGETRAPEVTLSRSALFIAEIKKSVLNQIVNENIMAIPMSGKADSPHDLAHELQQAVRSSGLFYESHLRGWVEGQVALQELFSEPQARITSPIPQQSGESQSVSEPRPVVHPQLEPLVRQQLDTFEQQRIAWHGPLWPDQQADILIAREPNTAETPIARAWRVRLALNTPTLGKVEADIALTGRRLHVRLNGENAGLHALREGRTALEHALGAHDLEVHPIHIHGGAA